MAKTKSGKVLREARERKGYDLATVARRLRIRPDILRAIEAGDFQSMPPRGYARNMVNAYAKLLGLNPTEIVEMYLDEVYAYQVEKARGRAPSSGFSMERDSRWSVPTSRQRGTRPSSAYGSTWSDDAATDLEPTDTYRSGNKVRHLYDDRTRYSRDDYGVTRERVERPGRSDRDFLSHHSGYASYDYGERTRSTSRSRGRDIHVGETPMEYSAPRFPRISRSPGVIIAAIVLALLVIVAIVFFVSQRQDSSVEDEVSQLPVSGISDTTGTAEEEEVAQVEIAPTSARVVMTVPSGADCYVETYLDGSETPTPLMLTGPAEESIEVTGTWTITTYAADNLKVTVNGEEVQLQVSEQYSYMYAYTVDFPAMLEEWKSTHTSKTSQRQAAAAEATAAAEQSKSSSSSAAEEGEGDAAAADGTAGADATAAGGASAGDSGLAGTQQGATA